MSRNRKDASLIKEQALPAQGASNQTDSLDLGSGDIPENLEVEMSVPDLPDLADGETATFTIQESQDGQSGWANAPWSPTLTLTGAGGNGASKATARARPPSTAKRYLRMNQALSGSAGDNTSVSGIVQFVF